MWSDVDTKERKEGLQQTHNRTKKKAQIRKEGREGGRDRDSLLFSFAKGDLASPRETKRRKTKAKEEGKEGKGGREEERLGRKKKLKTQISLGRPHVTSSDIHPHVFIHLLFFIHL